MCRLFLIFAASLALLTAGAQDITKPPGQQQPDQAKPLNAKEIFQKYKQSIVLIKTTKTKDGKDDRWVGTGFFYRFDYLIATAYHVIEGAKEITITDADGAALSVTDIVFDVDSDVALLRLAKASGRTPLEPAKFDTLAVGENIFVIGNPLGLFPDTISPGIISGKRSYEGISVVQVTAPISEGNSGGPIITEAGKAGGIISGSFKEGQSLNMGVSIDQAEKTTKGKMVAVADFIKDAGSGGITSAPGSKESKDTASATNSAKGAKSPGDLLLTLMIEYLTASAEYFISETDVLGHEWRNYAEILNGQLATVQAEINKISRDQKLTDALRGLGKTDTQLKETDDRMLALSRKWGEYVALRDYQIYVTGTGNGKEIKKAEEEVDAAYTVLLRAEKEFLAGYTSESWTKTETSVAIPAILVYQRQIFSSLRAQPDLDYPGKCILGVIYWKNDLLKKGDEILAIRLKKEKEAHAVHDWGELMELINSWGDSGQVVLRLKRKGAEKEVTFKLGG
jgi:serine protease Do